MVLNPRIPSLSVVKPDAPTQVVSAVEEMSVVMNGHDDQNGIESIRHGNALSVGHIAN